jgi:hypothetical protein
VGLKIEATFIAEQFYPREKFNITFLAAFLWVFIEGKISNF